MIFLYQQIESTLDKDSKIFIENVPMFFSYIMMGLLHLEKSFFAEKLELVAE